MDRRFVCSRVNNFLILFKVLKRLLAILHRQFIYFVNVNFTSIMILRSVTSFQFFIDSFSTKNVKLLLYIFWPRDIIWNFLGLPKILLILNYFKTICVSLDNFKFCLSRPYHFKFFKGCRSQIFLGPSLYTLPHKVVSSAKLDFCFIDEKHKIIYE